MALGVTCDARHLDLVHGVDQPGRRAGLAQDVAHVRDLRDARGFTAQGWWNLDAEQALPGNFGKGLAGETSLRVDRRSVRFGGLSRRAGARRQVVLADTDYPGRTRRSLRFHRLSPITYGLRRSRRHYAESPPGGQPKITR